MLMAGGRPEELADAIGRLVRGEITIPSPSEIHESTPILRSYPDHVREVESIYRETLGEAAEPAAEPLALTSTREPLGLSTG